MVVKATFLVLFEDRDYSQPLFALPKGSAINRPIEQVHEVPERSGALVLVGKGSVPVAPKCLLEGERDGGD